MFATSFVLGYHGCERKIGEGILAGDAHVTLSENVYDWLGHGAYFWENSRKRALDWAEFLTKHPPEPGAPLPQNEPATRADTDLVKRHLDCAVVNFVHLLRERENKAFDTVRGIFTEGREDPCQNARAGLCA